MLRRSLSAGIAGVFLIAATAGLPGCGSNAIKENRTTFLTSDDLVKMTDQMAQEILKSNNLMQQNMPLRIVIEPVINETNEIIRDNRKELFVQRVENLLATNNSLRDRFVWIINRDDFEKLRREEVPDLGPSEVQIQPEYALYAKFQVITHATSKGRSDAYLCTYFITRINGQNQGEQLWSGSYETEKHADKKFLD